MVVNGNNEREKGKHIAQAMRATCPTDERRLDTSFATVSCTCEDVFASVTARARPKAAKCLLNASPLFDALVSPAPLPPIPAGCRPQR